MGCGQSHLGIIYPRKSKNKDGSRKNGDGSENEEEEKDGESDSDNEERLRAARLKQIVQIAPGPLLASTEISSSQSDFFRMLDEKIESGPDYDSTSEYEMAMEHARLCRLLHDWEMAKIRSRNRLAMSAVTQAPKPVRHQANGNLQRLRYTQPPPTHHGHYPMANSVVTYDRRGYVYTELA